MSTSRTEVKTVHGTHNPQFIIEQIVRTKIYNCRYWKEHLFALNAETLVDKAVDLEYIGGTYGGFHKPSPFICLLLKMLQIQPDKEIVLEFIKNTDYKYVTALGIFYCRMIFPPAEVFEVLEILYTDLRKLRIRNADGKFEIIYMDEFIDSLLHKESYCSVVLPRIPKRHILESQGILEPRVSPLEEDLETEIQKERLQLLQEEVEGVNPETQEERRKRKEAKKWKKIVKGEKKKSKKSKKEKKSKKDKKSRKSNNAKSSSPSKPSTQPPKEGSIEYWNEIRSGLGLKPLQ